MKLAQREVGEVTIVGLPAEFGAADVRAFSAAVDALVGAGRTRVVVNLERVTFLDSSALGCLLETARRVAARAGALVLSEPPEFLRESSRILGLDRVLRVFPSDGEAIAHLARP